MTVLQDGAQVTTSIHGRWLSVLTVDVYRLVALGVVPCLYIVLIIASTR